MKLLKIIWDSIPGLHVIPGYNFESGNKILGFFAGDTLLIKCKVAHY